MSEEQKKPTKKAEITRSLSFGNPAVCVGDVTLMPWEPYANRPVAFRPTIARGLALSELFLIIESIKLPFVNPKMNL
jgi:hypothetical protein